MLAASGVEHTIAAHGYEASIMSVGASLRCLRFDGRDLVAPFEPDALRPALSGAVLAPWPNRLADGRYAFDGERYELAVNEPETATAAHGLVAWMHFACAERGPERLVLATRIEPQPGYPWRLRIEVEFAIDEHGLHQRITAINESARSAPVGLGAHPYLRASGAAAGEGAIDGWTLQVPADEVLLVSVDRMLPIGTVDVAGHDGGSLDFRVARRIGGTVLNHAFALARPAAQSAGAARIRVLGADGHGVELTLAGDVPWVQLYSADHLPEGRTRHALAVEPMTCPPDAFNTGSDLRVVPPGGRTTLGWSIRAV